ncbi:MAG: histidine--tRNA ligase [Candidatus Kerfeldbacteria bacterium]|nr:histidine--tRNA ligase [Candidatus Kerfeldbacteria bacterium]
MSKPLKKAKGGKVRPQLLRGMKDILPQDAPYWDMIRRKARELAESYSFSRVETPLLEARDLFERSIGEHTDIVSKEMFTFTDKGGESIAVRPEWTASACRAYIEHGMVNQPQPVKLWSFFQCFRRERPQAGRYRSFWQADYEVIGDADPVVDAELILILYTFLKELGIQGLVQINSLGTPETRRKYTRGLVEYYKKHARKLCGDCKVRLKKNPLRLLDCKVPECRELVTAAPEIIDFLDDESRKHFMSVLEYLDESEVPYNLNSRLVRGLDYYTRTLFELWPDREGGENIALGGGGRYDGLMKLLGGRDTPACGFAMGVDRVVLEMKEQHITPPRQFQPDVYLAQLGDRAKRRSLKLFNDLRASGVRIIENFSQDGLKEQLGAASDAGVRYTLILGQKEMLDNTILLRDMENGSQEVVAFEKIVGEVKKKLG